MTAGGSRLVAVFVILASLAVAIVVLWLAAFRHPRRSVRVVKPTTVLVAPPMTPLPRDSGPRNNAKPKTVVHATTKGTSVVGVRTTPSATTTPVRARRAPVTVRRPKTTVPKHKATPTPQTSTTPAQTPPPSPPPPPTAAVTTPAGTVTVCVKVLGC